MAATYPITLVTAYFDTGRKSKHFARPFRAWMNNFVPHVRWPLVVFCDEQSLDMLKRMRGPRPATYFVTGFEEFAVYRWRDLYRDWVHRSPAAHVQHSVEIGMIYNEKCNFLRRAIDDNPYLSEMFFWCDIGCFREDSSKGVVDMRLSECGEWPDLAVCRTLPRDKTTLIRGARVGKGYPVCGRFFGGPLAPVREWCDHYYEHLAWRIRQGTFTYSDEWIMMSLYEKQPQAVHMLTERVVPWGRLISFLARRFWAGHYFKWYFLNGGRFVWGYFRSEFFRYLKNPRLLKGTVPYFFRR